MCTPGRVLNRLIMPASIDYVLPAMNSYFESSKAVTY
jgi:hypothetical protein